MKKIIVKFGQYYFFVLLLILAIITHVNWFNPSTTLNSGDWLFFPDEIVKQLWRNWTTWITFGELGYSNPQISFYFFKLIWSIIGNLGFSYDVATKITFFIPIAILGFISPYILFKKIFQDNFIAFTAALFYGTTTPFLIRQIGHLPIAFVYALTPLILYFFILSLNKNKSIYWLFFISLFSIALYYELRITLEVLLILTIYFLIFHIGEIKKYLKNLIIFGVVLIGFNSFWLLPLFFGDNLNSIAIFKNRSLFGNWLFDLVHSFTLYENSWTGSYPNMEFIKQPVKWYFWIVPIFISISLFSKNKNTKKSILFFWIISLIGILLTKQSSLPFPALYGWLYDNIPLFGLFREASKFFLLTSLGYSALLGYSLILLKDFSIQIKKSLFLIMSLIIIFLSLYNTKPLLTKEIRTLFIPKYIPNDYSIVNKFISNQPDYFRTLWVPTSSRWGFFIDNHPSISAVGVVEYWSKIINSGFLESLPIFKYSFSNQLIDLAAVKYVFIPLQDRLNDDNFFIFYGKRQLFINDLNKLNYLKKINIGTKEIIIYENKDYRPHIYLTEKKETIYKNIPYQKIDFKYINPTQYKVNLINIKSPVYLNFSESYHPYWKIRVGPPAGQIKGALRAGEFNWFKAIVYKKYFLPDKYHFQNDAMLNSFYFDPKQICSDNLCAQNSDDSLDINLTLYFKPQSYFYLGGIISLVTFISCIIFLILRFAKLRRIK